jgi:hypothetical protein
MFHYENPADWATKGSFDDDGLWVKYTNVTNEL